MNDDLKYPIGPFELEGALAATDRRQRIETIANLPAEMRKSVAGLENGKLDEPYRPGGWSIRQLVHHVADSHINSYCRFKLALTEETPTIRAYDQDQWAELPDSKAGIESSLTIIDGLHDRWAGLLGSMDDSDFAKELDHPESGNWNLDSMLALYDWHSRHHTAHITSLRSRKNW